MQIWYAKKPPGFEMLKYYYQSSAGCFEEWATFAVYIEMKIKRPKIF